MTDDDRALLADAMRAMGELNADLRAFRAEMREFKTSSREFKSETFARMGALESDRMACQKDPTVCATARLLDSHVASHAGDKSRAVSVWAACVSTVMCAATLISTLVKRG